LLKPALTALALLALLAGIAAFQRPETPAQVTLRHQRHEFTPVVFHNKFAATATPVLRVSPGDTIRTTTIDAAGTDERGVRRGEAGNPQTGPFYINGAEPGDTIAVHLTRLRLNRDWAISTDTLSNLAMTPELAGRMKHQGQFVRWRLDIERGVATRENPPANLAQYAVPLKPMLGCIALAPPVADPVPHTGEFGAWGGNLDFNEIVEGTTVFLPVSVPGGLLYLGDGHAAQGDGELNGNGLETSMDVEIRVELLRRYPIPAPRVESSTHLMTVGLGASLDDALRKGTTNMVEWLMARHALTFSEVSQVLGTSAEYRVSVIVGRNAGIVIKVHKDRLQSFKSGLASGTTLFRGDAAYDSDRSLATSRLIISDVDGALVAGQLRLRGWLTRARRLG
jgi:amidase